ncbi:hypothetical protein U1Q18_029204 [Sarracenia purpurea var. burkii]
MADREGRCVGARISTPSATIRSPFPRISPPLRRRCRRLHALPLRHRTLGSGLIDQIYSDAVDDRNQISMVWIRCSVVGDHHRRRSHQTLAVGIFLAVASHPSRTTTIESASDDCTCGENDDESAVRWFSERLDEAQEVAGLSDGSVALDGLNRIFGTCFSSQASRSAVRWFFHILGNIRQSEGFGANRGKPVENQGRKRN